MARPFTQISAQPARSLILLAPAPHRASACALSPPALASSAPRLSLCALFSCSCQVHTAPQPAPALPGVALRVPAAVLPDAASRLRGLRRHSIAVSVLAIDLSACLSLVLSFSPRSTSRCPRALVRSLSILARSLVSLVLSHLSFSHLSFVSLALSLSFSLVSRSSLALSPLSHSPYLRFGDAPYELSALRSAFFGTNSGNRLLAFSLLALSPSLALARFSLFCTLAPLALSLSRFFSCYCLLPLGTLSMSRLATVQ